MLLQKYSILLMMRPPLLPLPILSIFSIHCLVLKPRLIKVPNHQCHPFHIRTRDAFILTSLLIQPRPQPLHSIPKTFILGDIVLDIQLPVRSNLFASLSSVFPILFLLSRSRIGSRRINTHTKPKKYIITIKRDTCRRNRQNQRRRRRPDAPQRRGQGIQTFLDITLKVESRSTIILLLLDERKRVARRALDTLFLV